MEILLTLTNDELLVACAAGMIEKIAATAKADLRYFIAVSL